MWIATIREFQAQLRTFANARNDPRSYQKALCSCHFRGSPVWRVGVSDTEKRAAQSSRKRKRCAKCSKSARSGDYLDSSSPGVVLGKCSQGARSWGYLDQAHSILRSSSGSPGVVLFAHVAAFTLLPPGRPGSGTRNGPAEPDRRGSRESPALATARKSNPKKRLTARSFCHNILYLWCISVGAE